MVADVSRKQSSQLLPKYSPCFVFFSRENSDMMFILFSKLAIQLRPKDERDNILFLTFTIQLRIISQLIRLVKKANV